MSWLKLCVVLIGHNTALRTGNTALKTATQPFHNQEAKWKVVYGTMFSDPELNPYSQFSIEPDSELLKTIWSTWAKAPCDEQRCFATVEENIGKKHTSNPNIIYVSNPNPSIPFEMKGKMGQPASLSYKRPHLFIEAERRDADWLVLHHTDNYIVADVLDKLLNKYNPLKPIVLAASIGCGLKEPTIENICPEAFKLGGLCGGGPYIFSRAAIKKMLVDGPEKLINEYALFASIGVPEDIADGCAFRKHSIEAQIIPAIKFEHFENACIKLSKDQENACIKLYKDQETSLIFGHLHGENKTSANLQEMHSKCLSLFKEH